MPDPRHLSRAPITEAIFDFRLPAPIDIASNHFDAWRPILAADYPDIEVKQQLQAQVRVEAGRVSVSEEPPGRPSLFVKTADGLTIGQFRSDGFTLNRLRPYTSWETLFPEALRLWQEYTRVTQASAVARLALRYINHLDLPIQVGDDFSLYLTMPPDLPEGLPQTVASFLMQFNTLDEPNNAAAIITQALIPPQSQGQFPKLLVDVDVYRVMDPPQTELSQIRETFLTLHDMKNRVFFRLLTEQCLQHFQ
jgi:uncharacterized protein (TIGR04255 family)